MVSCGGPANHSVVMAFCQLPSSSPHDEGWGHLVDEKGRACVGLSLGVVGREGREEEDDGRREGRRGKEGGTLLV